MLWCRWAWLRRLARSSMASRRSEAIEGRGQHSLAATARCSESLWINLRSDLSQRCACTYCVCERYVYSGTLFSLRKRRIVNFIQACPSCPRMKWGNSLLPGSLSSLHPLSLLCCYVLQPNTMGRYGRRIHASMGLYVSLRGDVAAAVVCR